MLQSIELREPVVHAASCTLGRGEVQRLTDVVCDALHRVHQLLRLRVGAQQPGEEACHGHGVGQGEARQRRRSLLGGGGAVGGGAGRARAHGQQRRHENDEDAEALQADGQPAVRALESVVRADGGCDAVGVGAGELADEAEGANRDLARQRLREVAEDGTAQDAIEALLQAPRDGAGVGEGTGRDVRAGSSHHRKPSGLRNIRDVSIETT